MTELTLVKSRELRLLRPEAISKYNDYGLPRYMINSVLDYIEDGVPPGGFLSAIIENDLRGAISSADLNNLALLPEWVTWFYTFAPASCWGKDGACRAWIDEFHPKIRMETGAR